MTRRIFWIAVFFICIPFSMFETFDRLQRFAFFKT
jgi:hypothetical protein